MMDIPLRRFNSTCLTRSGVVAGSRTASLGATCLVVSRGALVLGNGSDIRGDNDSRIAVQR